MALTGNLYKLVWGGTLFTTEEWACSMHIHSNDSLNEDPQPFDAPLTVAHTSSGARINGQASLDFVKFNKIDPITGKYSDPGAAHTYFSGTSMGAGAVGPGQLAMVVTLRTAAQRGRGSKGRFFTPIGLQAADFSSTGKVSASVALGIATAWTTAINAINALNPTADVVVFSKVGQLARIVTGVSVGHVPDTQRRRRNNLLEAPGATQAVT